MSHKILIGLSALKLPVAADNKVGIYPVIIAQVGGWTIGWITPHLVKIWKPCM
jgi:hypothetical protein